LAIGNGIGQSESLCSTVILVGIHALGGIRKKDPLLLHNPLSTTNTYQTLHDPVHQASSMTAAMDLGTQSQEQYYYMMS